MTTVTVDLNDNSTMRLRELAKEAGTAPEELLKAVIERWLIGQHDDLDNAAGYILNKYSTLYHRLA